MEYPHRPVLAEEVVRALVTIPDGIYVDGTVGSGGHSEAIGNHLGPKGRLICLDRDPEAIGFARVRLASMGDKAVVMKANYAELDEALDRLGLEKVHGVLLDLGVSTYQLDHSGRGFSFSRDEPLDMRMDPDSDVTAEHLINSLSLKDLENILRRYGEERKARSIVKAIARERRKGIIDSSLLLANLIESVVPRSRRPRERHPATRTFQALRIAVNRELGNLDAFLSGIPPLIHQGGRLVVLSYHSLEDRMVKQAMHNWEKGCCCPPDLPRCACNKTPFFRRVSKKGVRPSQREIDENPRARSATLRAAERI